MAESDKLIEEIKKTLGAIAKKNPQWRLHIGMRALAPEDAIRRLDNDKEFRKIILKHYVGLAVELEIEGRQKQFGAEAAEV